MLANEYDNQFDPNETEEERRRRLAQQSGTTSPTSTPTVEAQPSYNTTTAPTQTQTSTATVKPEAAAPAPVAAPAPPPAWDGGLATGYTAGSLSDVPGAPLNSGSSTGNLADLNAQMVGGSVWDAAAQRWRSAEEMEGTLNAARSGQIIDGYEGLGVVQQAAAPNAQLASVATQTNPLAVEQNTLRQLDYSKLPTGIGAGGPSLLEALQASGIPLESVLGGQQPGAGGVPLPINPTMPAWLPGMGTVPGTPTQGFYEGRQPVASGTAAGSSSPTGASGAQVLPGGVQTLRGVSGASPVAQGAASPTGYAASSFGPGSDLRSTQINPADSSDQSIFRQQRMNAANNLANGASRSEIAQQRLAAFDQAAEPAIRDGIRRVGQQASKFGRLGMGETEVETLRPYTDYLTQRAALSKNLAADTAEGEIGDRFNTLGAFRSLFGDEESTNASRRGEVRGERDWQQTLAQLAFENAFRTRGMENSEQQQAFQQALGLAGIGYGDNPYGEMLTGANQYGQNAGQSWEALAQLLAPYLSGGH
jgi:hypothetical protein